MHRTAGGHRKIRSSRRFTNGPRENANDGGPARILLGMPKDPADLSPANVGGTFINDPLNVWRLSILIPAVSRESLVFLSGISSYLVAIPGCKAGFPSAWRS